MVIPIKYGGMLPAQQFSGMWDIFIIIYYASKPDAASKSPRFGGTLRPEKSMWVKILKFDFFYLKRQYYKY